MAEDASGNLYAAPSGLQLLASVVSTHYAFSWLANWLLGLILQNVNCDGLAYRPRYES